MKETFTAALLSWYDQNKRDLPWRDKGNAYYTWISEIMLQQTRVETVKPYFNRFITELPDVDALASCPDEKLLKLWEGLGYYSRARNLKKAAGQIQARFQSRLPEDYEELLILSGIGDYTAGAIASIAYGKPFVAVDGNVLRVWSRIFAYQQNIASQEAKNEARKAMQSLLPVDRPGDYNQALMELGALVCLPKNQARCETCPVQDCCEAFRNGLVESLPVKQPPKERKIEKRTVFVIRDGDRTAVRKRPDKGLLAGLYELPNEIGWYTKEQTEEYVKKNGLLPLQISPLPEAEHIFSHIEWKMHGYLIRIAARENEEHETLQFIHRGQRKEGFAIPSAFQAYEKYIKEELI